MNEEDIKLREKICSECSFREPNKFIKDAYSCKVCGCDTDGIINSEYRKCSLGKW